MYIITNIDFQPFQSSEHHVLAVDPWDVVWLILGCLTCALFYTVGCLRPGLVGDRNEVTYGKWIPDI